MINEASILNVIILYFIPIGDAIAEVVGEFKFIPYVSIEIPVGIVPVETSTDTASGSAIPSLSTSMILYSKSVHSSVLSCKVPIGIS